MTRRTQNNRRGERRQEPPDSERVAQRQEPQDSERGEQRQELRKGARSYADAVTGNKPGVVTRSRAKAKNVFFVGAARFVEAAKRENDDNTWQEVDGALQKT